MEALSALEVAVALGMQPHREGGYFRETYRSPAMVETEAGPRRLATAILYLLTAAEPSRFHRLRFDELWMYHAGASAELILLGEGGPEYNRISLHSPQAFVPARRWMAARVIEEHEADWGIGRAPERRWTPDRRATRQLRWTLVSCVVAPGFEYDDFELGEREVLLKEFPQAREAILALT
jgi:predicted cupin superfamily sugar epimerase